MTLVFVSIIASVVGLVYVLALLTLPGVGRGDLPREQTPLEWAYGQFYAAYDEDFVQAIIDLELAVERIDRGEDPRPRPAPREVAPMPLGYFADERPITRRNVERVAHLLTAAGPVEAALWALSLHGLPAGGHAEIVSEEYAVAQFSDPVPVACATLQVRWRQYATCVILPGVGLPGRALDTARVILEAADLIASHADMPFPRRAPQSTRW